MNTAKEYLSAFSKCGSVVHLETIIRSMLLNLESAEEGLSNKSRPKAAYTECYVYAKSSFVLKDIYSYFAALTLPEEDDEDYVHLPAREIRLADECPAYLDIFEKYINDFGDSWYDPPEHRNTFFKEIYYAFRWVCNYLLVMSGLSFDKDREIKRAYTFFMRDFKTTALMDGAEERSNAIPLLLKNFREIRPTLEAALDVLINLERDLLLKETKYQGGYRICTFDTKLAKNVRFAISHNAFLCSLPGDERPLSFPDDRRYEAIATRMWIWSAMPPSVTRFVESCKLLEQAAVLATKGFPDFNFSSRSFVHVNLSILDDHPKYCSARNVLEAGITTEEKSVMGAAFARLAKALLRLRKVLRGRTCYGEEDIDEYDRFIAGLPRTLECEGKSFEELLFAGDTEEEADGFNTEMLYELSEGARKLAYVPPYDRSIEADSERVNAALIRIHKTNNRAAIDQEFAKLEEMYFKSQENAKRANPRKKEEVISIEPPHEIAMPGAKDSIRKRFSVAPETSRIVDLQHNEAPYYLPAYEGITQDKPIGYINQLIGNMGCNAHGSGDKYGGWIKLDDKWRMAFKDGVYKRFKREQIQIGTKGNGHLGECRIIPDNLFKELTKAKPPTSK